MRVALLIHAHGAVRARPRVHARPSRHADNVAWEDPRVDEQLLKLGPDDTLLVLTTGGCNVLDRLIDGPRQIVAADLNGAQNALLELKLACLRALTYEQARAHALPSPSSCRASARD